ncbi:MAG: DNA-binding response regulator [Desulfobacteraceae bacterium]|jgi:DNA-binding NarL/FixJ family response regulator|nr:MAG: DNA-binding response regulator [Desulfobacteraceae bacterium]
MKKTVIIAEDHTILRDGLRALLNLSDAFEVIGEATNGIEAIRCASECLPDIAILDLSMPKMNGISAIREIKKQSPKTKILVLTIHQDEEYILTAFQTGADGYCLKDARFDEVLNAMKTILSGKPYMSGEVSAKVLTGYLEEKKTIKSTSTWETITPREKEILKLIAEGYKSADIADILFISVKTVNKHRSNLMEKLDLHNVSALTVYAIERGLVSNREV